MNIIYVLREYPKSSETFIHSQIEGLIAQGHRVTIISLRKPDKSTVARIPFDNMNIQYANISGNILKNTIQAVKSVLNNLNYGYLKKIFSARNISDIILLPLLITQMFSQTDVIIVHFGNIAHWYADIANRFGITIPLVAVFHGVDVARYIPALAEKERNILWQYMSRGLPVSEFWCNRLIALGCPPEKLTVHHMGIDPAFFTPRTTAPDTEPFTLVTVCRLVEKKGIDTILRALAKLERSRTIQYTIIGDGPEHGRLKELAGTLEISGSVQFLGSLPPDQVAHHLNHAHAFILTSKTALNGDMEGIPVSLMEAMACGLPVISTRHSGIPELIEDGVSGLLIDENDSDGATHAIRQLIDNPNLGLALGKAAYQRVMDLFNIKKLTNDLEMILSSLHPDRNY